MVTNSVKELVGRTGPSNGQPGLTSTESVLVHLVRVILDDVWSPQVAAARLLEAVGSDRRSLRLVHARVLVAATERATPITARALTTLDAALARPQT